SPEASGNAVKYFVRISDLPRRVFRGWTAIIGYWYTRSRGFQHARPGPPASDPYNRSRGLGGRGRAAEEGSASRTRDGGRDDRAAPGADPPRARHDPGGAGPAPGRRPAGGLRLRARRAAPPRRAHRQAQRHPRRELRGDPRPQESSLKRRAQESPAAAP